MSNKSYFENISAKFSFLIKYLRVFRLLVIISYLFYLEMLVVNVFSAVEYVPSIDEVKERFLPVMAKSEVVNSIEKYFSDKENNLAKNLQKEARNNPFQSYKINDLNNPANEIVE
ncbi:MAG: hypothetical protein Q8N37_00205 [bacterium]|nr:hypothetical protein [bacterium]